MRKVGFIFDLDGVIVDSEQAWAGVREQLARERGGSWHDRAQADMMGMSSVEGRRHRIPTDTARPGVGLAGLSILVVAPLPSG